MTDFLQELSDDIRLTEFDSFAEALLQLLEKHLDTACAGCFAQEVFSRKRHGSLSTS